MQLLAPDVRVSFAGDRRALASRTVQRVVTLVTEREREQLTELSVVFVSVSRMRGLHRRHFGKDRSTDVIAFPLQHGNGLIGDVYICPAVARRSARARHIDSREELVRLLVHGVLHVLGYDHPTGQSRLQSEMWRRQERYVAAFMSEGSP